MSDWIDIDGSGELWAAEYRVPGIKSRTTAIRLGDGSYLAYSPGAGLEDAFAERGEVSWLLAPNSFHHLGIEAWRERFPAARLAAARGARARLRKQGHETEPLRAMVDDLPAQLELLEPPGTRVGELWLEHADDRHTTWLVGDAFFNMRTPRQLRGRIIQRVAQAGPGFAVSHLMKYGGLSDRRAYKTWATTQLAHRRPDRLIPCHGEITAGDDVTDRLSQLLERRL